MYIIPPGEEADLDKLLQEEYELTSFQDLIGTLDEHQQILDFFPEAQRVQNKAEEEHLRWVFHVFADRFDDFVESSAEALSLYLSHRADGKPNVRLWYELQDKEGEMVEENHMIGWGGYPQ